MRPCRVGDWFRTSGFSVALGIIIAATAGMTAMAQDERGRMDEKALIALKAMSDYIGGSETISFRSKAFFDVVRESGIKIKAGRSSKITIKRPNHLNILAEGDDGSGATIWYDGSKLTLWLRDKNEAMSLDFSGTVDKMLDQIIEKHDAQIPLADLFYSDVNAAFKKELLSAEYVGIRLVDGVKCHLLSFESPGVDWQIWIEANATPVPRRFVIDFVGLENKPQYMAQMSEWSVGGAVQDYSFVAAVPDTVRTVEFKLTP